MSEESKDTRIEKCAVAMADKLGAFADEYSREQFIASTIEHLREWFAPQQPAEPQMMTFDEWFGPWRDNHSVYFQSVDWRLREHLVKTGWEYGRSPALIAAEQSEPAKPIGRQTDDDDPADHCWDLGFPIEPRVK